VQKLIEIYKTNKIMKKYPTFFFLNVGVAVLGVLWVLEGA